MPRPPANVRNHFRRMVLLRDRIARHIRKTVYGWQCAQIGEPSHRWRTDVASCTVGGSLRRRPSHARLLHIRPKLRAIGNSGLGGQPDRGLTNASNGCKIPGSKSICAEPFHRRGPQIQVAEKVTNEWAKERTALVIAHPGHELRIHHWLERACPVTFVFTDGSGHTDHSRLASTTAVLKRAGARCGAIYGAMSDRELYRAVLAGEHDVFTGLADELASALQREGVTYVVGDAVEGVNPSHDVSRLVLNAALLRIAETGGRPPRNMEYPVEAPPDECPPEDRAEAIFLTLDDAAFARKMEAVSGYPEMAREMERVLAIYNTDVFRIECIRPVRYGLEVGHRFQHPCVYEKYGEKQVAAGIYREVLRFREHVAPLARHLDGHGRATG